MTSEQLLIDEYEYQKALSLKKNVAYGDSALHPLQIFSKLGATEGIRARLDDKLARIQRGDEHAFDENPIDDIIGYLVLLKVAERTEQDAVEEAALQEIVDIVSAGCSTDDEEGALRELAEKVHVTWVGEGTA